jgi:hypothetical protein
MTLTLTRAGTRLPGAVGRLHLYHGHASGLCHLGVFPHVSGGAFQNAPVAIFVHGEGLGCEPGWGSMTNRGALATGHLANLAQALHAAGWIIVTIDYPVCSRNYSRVTPDGDALGEWRIFGSWKEVHPIAVWPEQPMYVARAVQYVKSNWSGVEGPTETLFGRELWGEGNSIDPARTIVVADKWGATLAMQALLQPTGFFPFERGLAHQSMDPFVPRASHRVAALVCRDPGPIDFTQFYVHPDWDDRGQPDYLSGDFFGPMGRLESQRRWGSQAYGSTRPIGGNRSTGSMIYNVVRPAWKRNSPWWLLQEAHVENANLPLHVECTGTGFGADDDNLASTDWNPGFMASNVGAGKCWQQPHDGRIQGPALRAALQLDEPDLLTAYFGDAPSAPATPLQ